MLRVALDTPLRTTFDYLAPAALDPPARPGARVRVPFGRQSAVGLVVELAATSEVAPGKLKAIEAVIDTTPALDEELLGLMRWAADYYHHPIGEVLFTALPQLARKGRVPKEKATGKRRKAAGVASPATAAAPDLPPVLGAEQRAAVDAIAGSLGRYGAFLLHGITGSGKTEVYLHLVEQALARGERALVLVPEIGLTPQLIGRFAARFPAQAATMAVMHSGLTPAQRLAAWHRALTGEARLVLGTRSAVFAPVPALGLIVVDEEHDPSFKQHEGGFRYSARDVAVMRAQRAGVPIVMGSATPSLESLHNAQLGRYARLPLPRRAGEAVPPRLALVDLRQQAVKHGLSGLVLEAMRRHLGEDGQVLVFLNRRGYAPTLACIACGWTAECGSCDARYTVHRASARLKCHHCGSEGAVPERCPRCGYEAKAVGQGTERVEEALAEIFPESPIARLDRDVVRHQDELAEVVGRVASGEARILVGTQMVTKGHDFPNVTLAVVLNADQGLFHTDFRAAERLAQTIVQVAGRAGRGTRAGEVLIQSEYPDHPLLAGLVTEGYEGFAQRALQEREEAGWPPFGRLAAVRASARTLATATDFLGAARAQAEAMGLPRSVRLLGPAPATMARRADRYHAQLLVESADRPALHRVLDAWLPGFEKIPEARRVRWALDVDPAELF